MLATITRSVRSRSTGLAALLNDPHAQEPVAPSAFCQIELAPQQEPEVVLEDADHVGREAAVGLAPEIGHVDGDAPAGFELPRALGEHRPKQLEVVEIGTGDAVAFELLLVLLAGEVRRRGHHESHRAVVDRVHRPGITVDERLDDGHRHRHPIVARQVRALEALVEGGGVVALAPADAEVGGRRHAASLTHAPTRSLEHTRDRDQDVWRANQSSGAGPRVVGRGAVVARPLIAVEAVPGIGVPHHLGLLTRRRGGGPELLDLVDRDAVVEVAEQPEPRRLQVGGLVDERPESETSRRDAAAVEGDRRPQRTPRRDEEGDGATHAEADDEAPLRRDGGPVQLGQRRVDVGHDAVGRQLSHVRLGRVHVAVRHLGVAAAVEEVGGDGQVPLGREPPGHVLDVVVDAERFLNHDHSAPWFSRGLVDGQRRCRFGDHGQNVPPPRVLRRVCWVPTCRPVCVTSSASTSARSGRGVNSTMGYQLGIDLGTTYTAAAVHRNGRVEVAALGDRSTVIPSVVFVKDDGGVLTGDAANRRGRSEPERVAREFKRRVGDPAPIIIGGVPYSADVLTARLLRSVVDQVAEREGSYPDAIAVTHPANWGAYKLDLLRQAVRHAGFGGYPVTYLTEPQAAAIHYSSQERVAPGAVMGVYDLGGGTFDAAVLRRTADGGFEIIGQPEGIERLGGIDFDAAVLAHVDNSLDGAVSGLDVDDREAVQAVGRLRADAVEAKEQLSSDVDVSIPISIPGVRHDVRLTRGEFENMIRPAVNETITALRRALDSAGVQPQQVQAVLLVGGSSRIPLVGQMVSAALGRPVAVDAHPKHAIAQGAAVAAAQAAGAATADTVTVVHTEEAAPAPVAVPPVGPAFEPPAQPPAGPPHPQGQQAQPPDQLAAQRRRRRMVPIAIGGAAALILAAVGFFALRGGDDPPAGGDDPVAGAVSDQGDMWIGSTGLGGLVKVNRADREIVANLPIQNVFDPPVVGEEFVWAVAGGGGIGGPIIYQIDRADATVVNRIPVPLSAAGEEGGNIELRAATGGIWARVTQSGTPATVLHVNDDGEIDVEAPTEVNAFSLASDGDRAYVLGFDGVIGSVDLEGTVRQSGTPIASGGLFVAQGEPHILAEDRIVRVDPEQMTAAETVDYVIDGSAGPLPGFDDLYPDLIVDGSTLYGAVGSEPASFFEIDVETGDTELAELPIDGNIVTVIRLAQGDADTVWAYSRLSGGQLARIDVANDDIDAITVSDEGIGDAQLVAAPDLVGVFESAATPNLSLIDDQGEIVEELSTFLFRAAPAFAGGAVWLADFIGGTTTPFATGDEEFGTPLEVAGLAREAAGVVFLPTGTGELLAVNSEDPANPTPIQLPQTAGTVVTDGERVWADGDNVFMTIDPATLTVTGTLSNTDYIPTVDYPFVANRTVAGGGALWDLTETGVNRIDVTTGQATPITLIGTPVDVSFEAGFAWVTSDDGQVARLDPATGSQVGGIDAGDAAGYVEAAGDNVYFIEMDGGLVREIVLSGPDAAQTDNIIETIEIGPGLATALTVDDELWVANQSTGVVTRIDFAGLTEEIDVGGRPVGIVGDAEGVFVVDQDGGQLIRIDPESGEIQDFEIE